MAGVISDVVRSTWASYLRGDVLKIVAASVAATSTADRAATSPTTTGRCEVGVGDEVPHRYDASAPIVAASTRAAVVSTVDVRRLTGSPPRTRCRRSASDRP